MKKKTLVLTENFPPLSGGSGRWFWELYSRLPREDYLIVADNAEGAALFDQSHDLNIVRMPLKSREWGFKSKQGLSHYWRTFWALRKLITQHNITHIHCGRVIHEGVTSWLLSRFSRLQYSCYVHGEDVETAATSREHDLMVRQVCKGAQSIICNSYNSEAIVKRLGYADSSKIKVLHPGVNTQHFKPAAPDPSFREKMGWAERLVIITVGRLQRRKGQDYMVEAMATLSQSYPQLLYCIIGSGELQSELEQRVQQLGLQQQVQLRSGLSDQEMIQCYQQCDLFLLPNRTIDHDVEGFGMVLIEAQACGKPAIAGNSGGTLETLVEGETGHIIDCSTPDALSNNLSDLLSNAELLLSMGHRGRARVEQEFDWQVHVQKAKAIFQ